MKIALEIIVIVFIASPFILIFGILCIGFSVVVKHRLYCKRNGHTWKTIYIDRPYGGFKTTCQVCSKESKNHNI